MYEYPLDNHSIPKLLYQSGFAECKEILFYLAIYDLHGNQRSDEAFD